MVLITAKKRVLIMVITGLTLLLHGLRLDLQVMLTGLGELYL